MSSGKSQSLRKSQFIFTYGPGALIESANGPRLIPSLHNGIVGEYWKHNILERLEIKDKRLPKFLSWLYNQEKKGDFDYRIFSLPTNASLGIDENKVIYCTKIFPEWHICYNSKEHAKKGREEKPILHNGLKCPVCNKSILENHGTVRFILACPAGHMDDIDWVNEVHHSKKCSSKYFYWDAKGSSLESIKIICPDCGAKTDMQAVYKSHPKCTGRYPEKETKGSSFGNAYTTTPDRKGCKLEMRVMQRQSASLRVAETITLLSLPRSNSPIENILSGDKVKDVVINSLKKSNNDESKFKEYLNFMAELAGYKNYGLLDIIEYIDENGWDAFIKLTEMLYLNTDEKKSFLDLINEEYDALLNPASVDRESDGTFLDDFIIEGGRKENYTSLHLFPAFTLYPIRRIRTVTVQTNYRRMVSIKYGNCGDEIKQTPVPVSSTTYDINSGRKSTWFPGFEGYGEGLFLHFDTSSFEKLKHGKAYNNWLKYTPDESVYTENWKDICSLPEFVWLHTISHALIRSISEKTGYSAASIRERVYYVPEKREGGILLYNTTPGSDGGLGGLIDVTNIFEDVLIQAEEYITICSNDPLCHRSDEVKQDGTKVNGSACYGCMLIAETSCEHGNRWLDRDLLLEGENGR